MFSCFNVCCDGINNSSKTAAKHTKNGRDRRKKRKSKSNKLSLPIPKIDVEDTQNRLKLILNWLIETMTDSKSNRFYYEYDPQQNILSHKKSPIRDLGTAWNAANIIKYFRSQNKSKKYESKCNLLSLTVENTMKYYLNNKCLIYYKSDYNMNNNININDCARIKSSFVNEISNIAHSAFLILSAISSYHNNIINDNLFESTVPYLVNGILNNQNLNKSDSKYFGAFKVNFDGQYNYNRGIELYPAEAMLSLLSYHQYLSLQLTSNEIKAKQSQIIDSIMNGFKFYSKYFYDKNISSEYIVFYSNWQTQIFCLLFQILYKDKLLFDKDSKYIIKYIFDLQDFVLKSNTFQSNLNVNGNKYDKISTVEVACGLEALLDGLFIAYNLKDIQKAKRICNGIENAITFLNIIQMIENGGFGHGIFINKQRIDVTGHVSNAYLKIMHLF